MSRFRELFGEWCWAKGLDLVRDTILLTCDSDGWISRRIVVDWSSLEEGEHYRVLFVDDRKGRLDITDAVFHADALRGYAEFCRRAGFCGPAVTL